MIAKNNIRKKIEKFCASKRDLSRYNPDRLHKVICIVDADAIADVFLLENTVQRLLPQVSFSFFLFTNNSTRLGEISSKKASGRSCILKTNYSLLGHPKDTVLQDLPLQSYDLLINYFKDYDPLMFLSSTLTKSLLRMGFKGVDPRINDVIFDTDIHNIKGFTLQMIPYINIINKKKNG